MIRQIQQLKDSIIERINSVTVAMMGRTIESLVNVGLPSVFEHKGAYFSTCSELQCKSLEHMEADCDSGACARFNCLQFVVSLAFL